jgi:hypothetical protein
MTEGTIEYKYIVEAVKSATPTIVRPTDANYPDFIRKQIAEKRKLRKT